MSNGAFIGRVGALAVALGVGAAVTAWPGLALAETAGGSPSSTDASPSSDSTASNTASSHPAAGSNSTPPSAPEAPAPAATPAPSTPTSPVETADPREGTVQSSGGPHTGSFGATADPTEEDGTTSGRETAVDGQEKTPSRKHSTAHDQQARTPEPPRSTDSAAPKSPPATAPGPRSAVAVASDPQTPAGSPHPVTAATTLSTPVAALLPVVENAPQPVMTAAPATLRATQPPNLVDLVLDPYLTDDPGGAPAESPLSWSLLAWTRRRGASAPAAESGAGTAQPALLRSVVVTSTVTGPSANTAPVAGTPTVGSADPITGVVTGSLNFSDPDGDALSYTVTSAPTKGKVTVNSDGTFVYMPTQAARVTAYSNSGLQVDGFGVTASDGKATAVVTVSPRIDPVQFVTRAPVAVGYAPLGVAHSPDGSRLYVANNGDDVVSVIDTATNALMAPIFVGNNSGPADVAVTPDGARLYVALTGDVDGVAVIDTATHAVVTTIVADGTVPVSVALSRDGSRAYVANEGNNTMSVIDTTTNSVVATVIVGESPRKVALSPDGTRAYVASIDYSTRVIDTATNTVVGTIGEFSGVLGIAVSPDGKVIYASNYSPNQVSVIDPATNTLLRSIQGFDGGTQDVRFSPDGSLAYVANEHGGSVSVVDVAANRVIATLPTGASAYGVAVSPDGVHAYISNRGDDTVTEISLVHANRAPVAATPTFGPADPATGAVTGSLNFTDPDGDPLSYTVTGNQAKGMLVVNPDGTFTYTPTEAARLAAYKTAGPDADGFTVTASDGRATTAATVDAPIDAARLAVVATIPVAINPSQSAITPDGRYLYLANNSGGGMPLTVVDTRTNAVVATANTDGNPRFVATSADGARVYATNITENTLSVIDTATNHQVANVPVGSFPIGVAVSLNGKLVYVANLRDNTVSVIDTGTNAVVATVATSNRPYGLTVSPDGGRLYVANQDPGVVTVIDTTSNAIVTTVAVGSSPAFVATSPDGNRLYVNNFSDSTISVIDTASNAVVATIPVDGALFDISLSPDGSLAYVPTGSSNALTVIDTTTGAVVGSVAVDRFSIGVSTNPQTGDVYVSNADSKTISVVALVSSPANVAPTLVVTQVGDVDPTTGAVTFQANATDPDGDPLTYTVTAATAKGVVEPNADGTYTYTPSGPARHAASADGATAADKADSFFITVTDPSGASATVTTAVVITGKNAAPSGGMSSSTVDFSTGTVTGTFALGDGDGDALTYSGTTDTAKGHLAINPDGTFVFTPTDAARHAASSDTADPADRMDVVSFTANDGHGGIVTAQLNVAVIAKNSAPTAGTATSIFTGTTGATTGSIGATDADSDVLRYRLTGNPAKGTVTVNPDGTYSYTTTAANRHLAAADNATPAQKQDTFTVSVDDAHGGVTPFTVTTQINPQNAAPTIALTQSGNPNTTTGAITYTVTARDADNDPLTYTVSTNPTKGTLVRNANGTYTYAPTAAARHDAALTTATTAQKQDTFAITVTDAHGGTTTATANPTITAKNAPPTVTLTQVGTANATTGTVTYQLNGSDPDGDATTYRVTTNPAKGTAVVNADGTLSYTPTDAARHLASATNATAAQRQDTFTITADDAHGGSATASARVTISPRNATPTLSLTQVGAANAATGAITYATNGNDLDGDALTYSVSANPTRGSLARNADGSYTYTPTARHTAAADTATTAQKQDTFTLTATDAHGATGTASANPIITGKNTAPTVTLTQSGGANTTTGAITYTVTARDADGDPLAYTVSTNPTKGTVVRNTNGSYTYTPTAAARHDAALTTATPTQKQDTFAITVTDAHGGSTTATATPTISPTNTGPSGSPTVGAPNAAGVVTGTIGSTDQDGDSLTYTVTTGPGRGSVVVNPNGSFAYTPTASAQHTAAADNATAAQKRDTFTVAVTDGHGGTQNVSLTTQVAPRNVGPAASPTATNPSISTGTVAGSVGGSDQDGDALVYTVTARPTKGTLSVSADGNLTYTPTAAARAAASRPNATPTQQQDTFSISVKDGHGGSSLVTYTVPLSQTSSGNVVIVVNPSTSTT